MRNGNAVKCCLLVGLSFALLLSGCEGMTEEAKPRAKVSASSSPTAPEPPPLPVWYDDDGLHHGNSVVRTPVDLTPPPDPAKPLPGRPHLALVRTGVVFNDPATDDVWFHPWGGRPRVVGHGSRSGPGGDPQGDVAAWFEGWHLVVYDTAKGKVVSRTREVAGVEASAESPEHVGHGNGFVHVSAHQVVWRSPDGLGRRDLDTGTSILPWQPRVPGSVRALRREQTSVSFVDVSGTSAVWTVSTPEPRAGEPSDAYVADGPGTDPRPVTGMEGAGRLSPDGRWLLTAEGADGTHGVAMTDLRTGRQWKPFRKAVYAFYSWSYGEVAVLRVNRDVRGGRRWSLVACHAVRRTCADLPTRGDAVILPNP